MKKVVLASHNPGKRQEISAMLPHLTLVSISEYSSTIPEETGLTFIENALIKARAACHATNLPAIADDSGLIVPALGGEPGVYSARYAQEEPSWQANNAKVLQKLQPHHDRQATMYCCLVYLRHTHDPAPITCIGTWEGIIAESPQGEHGFGYDPIFYLPSLGCTAAELHPAQKNSISHRSQALHQLMTHLQVPLVRSEAV